MQFSSTPDYVVPPDLAVAVNAAITLERPLLVKGEPGTGKTELARQVATSLGLPIIEWNVKSTTRAQQGLYEYDAVSRLRDSQLGDGRVHDIANYIRKGKLWQAFEAPGKVVLLIDEIDKADIEFPNDLLQELDRMEFHVYETGETVAARHRPIVIITSNRTREIHDALKRRCLYHWVDYPTAERELAIVKSRVPNISAKLSQQVVRFVQALRESTIMDFKGMFRNVNMLMVDDVQFIAGKDSTQEEFFHTFNALVDQGKQIVISADRAPAEIKGLEERIKSRLSSGLIVDVHPTTYELRLGILQSKTEVFRTQQPDLEIGAGVLEFLAHRITTNVRVLEGALQRLFAHASLLRREITLEVAQECLADILRTNDRKISIDDIQRKVAEHYNIRLADMVGPKRARNVARPRQIAMYLSKQLTSRSLPEIGRRFGGRDHTTIMHGIRKVEELVTEDHALAEDVALLKRLLEA